MKGRKINHSSFRAPALGILLVVVGTASDPAQAQPAFSRPGQRGESPAREVIDFSELAAHERHHPLGPRPSRPARAHLKASAALPTIAPEIVPSGEITLDALDTPMASELTFSSAAVTPSP